MNVVVLLGRLSSPPRRTQLPSGDERWALELSCASCPGSPAPGSGDTVMLTVPVAVVTPCAAVTRFDTGTQLVVTGVVRRRFYRSSGVTQSRTEVVARSVVEVTSRRTVNRALATAMRALGRDQARTLRSVLPDDGAA